jgi:hypothetical protein
MAGVKIKKIPMKNLSPKEMAELAFDRGVTIGGSGTANTLKRGGLKRGAYGQGVGKYKDGGDVKYKGPLPKSKPTAFERWKGERSVNKPTTTEDQDRISKRMAEKFKKSPKAQRYEGGGEVRGMGRAYQGNKRGCKIR